MRRRTHDGLGDKRFLGCPGLVTAERHAESPSHRQNTDQRGGTDSGKPTRSLDQAAFASRRSSHSHTIRER